MSQSAEDQTCINEMIANPGNYKPNQWSENMYDPGYFVGATDAAEEGKWKWPNKDDDEVISYLHSTPIFSYNLYICYNSDINITFYHH